MISFLMVPVPVSSQESYFEGGILPVQTSKTRFIRSSFEPFSGAAPKHSRRQAMLSAFLPLIDDSPHGTL